MNNNLNNNLNTNWQNRELGSENLLAQDSNLNTMPSTSTLGTTWNQEVKEFREQPKLEQVIEQPSVEIRNQKNITEVREKPNIVFQEQPFVVQSQQLPEQRFIQEQPIVENLAQQQPILSPYQNLQPQFRQEAAPITETTEVTGRVIEKPTLEVHKQPLITEVVQKPIIETRQQEIIRTVSDQPIVQVVREQPQILESNVGLPLASNLGTQQTYVQQPLLTQQQWTTQTVTAAPAVREEVHTIVHPVGKAQLPPNAEVIETTDPTLKPEEHEKKKGFFSGMFGKKE